MFAQDASRKKIGILSGGEKSRVLLGQILAKPCNLLLLDEPTHHLDMESIEALIEALEEFEGGVVIVTHSELILKRLTLDKMIVCHLGHQEVFMGDYEEFLEKKGWEEESSKPAAAPKEERQTYQEKGRSQGDIKHLENRVKQIEKRIALLEKSQEDLHKKMQEAVEKKDFAETQKLVDVIDSGQKQLDSLWEEFMQASAKLKSLF